MVKIKLYNFRINGCYNAIQDRQPENALPDLAKGLTVNALPENALQDLTGGVTVRYDLGDKTPNHLFNTLNKALWYETFVCSTTPKMSPQQENETGLVGNHSYTVINAFELDLFGMKFRLIKIRGLRTDPLWKGKWGIGSPEWDKVSRADKDRLKYKDPAEARNTGDWWMDYHDFKHYFASITVCAYEEVFNKDAISFGNKWYLSKADGEWSKKSAGGCNPFEKDFFGRFATNPQYSLELSEAGDEPDGKSSIVIGLTQEYQRAWKPKGHKEYIIALVVFKVADTQNGRLDKKFFENHTCVLFNIADARQCVITAEIPRGRYVIIPTTLFADEYGKFILNVCTEKKVKFGELQ